MKSYTDYINEVLITFSGKAYPKFNQIVILGGGSASGKGFQIKNLLGIEGKVLDVDALKDLAIKSNVFAKRVKTETGVDMSKIDKKNPENVSKLHDILNNVYSIPDKRQQLLAQSILTSDVQRKPNLIFDVTLKDMTKLEEITRSVVELGYNKRDIHIVWVINSIDIAIQQNSNRSRTVSSTVLMTSHEGVSLTMRKILAMGDKLKSFMDGSIVFTFNQSKVDTEVDSSVHGGKYIKKANYVRVKEVGKPQKSPDELDQEVINKIREYTPKIENW